MPSQKECMDINDRMMLSRAARDARAEHCQRYHDAKGRIDGRMERRQVKAARQAAMCRVLDGVLVGVCIGALLVMACVALAYGGVA